MRVLLDSCVSGAAGPELTLSGHEVIAAAAFLQDPGDEELLRLASAENRVLVTLDKDYGELAIVHRMPHCGIIRLVGIRAGLHGAAVNETLVRYGAELIAGAIITISPGKVRIRPQEGRP